MSRPRQSPQRRQAVGALIVDPVESLLVRRLASLRCPPLRDGRRDPLDPHLPLTGLAMPFGLDPDELTAEALRLRREGWYPWEVSERLGSLRDSGGHS